MTDLTARTRAFVRDVVLPCDDEHDGDVTAAGGDRARLRWQEVARDAGVFAPHVPAEFGGQGLGMVARAPVFEEAVNDLMEAGLAVLAGGGC